ncbi:hypothetical protein A2954_06530 [Candidatus Roizmanbacteria bacterium RIFCSPLOWO2_01_FULL_37_12]|uniref:Uncharacterized protein n=1 Tax=Candidatus Roizmanbacteria bacterium RIFCSPLOWO2_01_FULL_37_12 TaxID=1802056 RepID=A0A1F7I9Y3_9BACT|nr:MAG: hypothetical protein A2768_00735 [Candidatus Roizmanbacteria bacterium RIFCSPHIGHO2_01_FULL_37_16]OGK26840.1 MAG: hypothetical protein A3D76_05150 [Candidatus Roizmanbacteria bacterium RIFCSPHIGHO2_02_FULL_37_9b]OGK40163.1 MAG: hypothetical protein A2954_06530 [Candidatus Roizmanbacteria bacterium RIFCSPLOWO2_01_FULL_37_12]
MNKSSQNGSTLLFLILFIVVIVFTAVASISLNKQQALVFRPRAQSAHLITPTKTRTPTPPCGNCSIVIYRETQFCNQNNLKLCKVFDYNQTCTNSTCNKTGKTTQCKVNDKCKDGIICGGLEFCPRGFLCSDFARQTTNRCKWVY